MLGNLEPRPTRVPQHAPAGGDPSPSLRCAQGRGRGDIPHSLSHGAPRYARGEQGPCGLRPCDRAERGSPLGLARLRLDPLIAHHAVHSGGVFYWREVGGGAPPVREAVIARHAPGRTGRGALGGRRPPIAGDSSQMRSISTSEDCGRSSGADHPTSGADYSTSGRCGQTSGADCPTSDRCDQISESDFAPQEGEC